MKLIPAMRGSIGTTEYYFALMKASEVVNSIRIPKEMPDWGTESIEERYQREINYKRVKEQIAPYLAIDPDRFFNALIVDILDHESVSFDKLTDIAKIPSYLGNLGDNFGILKLDGSERLVPLDGQHRLAALKFALYGKDEKDQPIENFRANPDIGGDEIALILIKHDRAKARKIFNKVNRYAKAVSKADNLIISEDDYVAVVSREIANTICKSLVNSKSNTIPDNSNDVTTLSTIYDSNLEYLSESVFYERKVNVDFLPDQQTQALWRSELETLWESLINGVPLLADAFSDPSENARERRVELRKEYVLMKPVVQGALVIAIKRLMDDGISLKTAVERVAMLNWQFDNPEWDRIAVNPGRKIVSGKQDQKFLARVIAYRLGENLAANPLQVLLQQYLSKFDKPAPDKKLPPKVV